MQKGATIGANATVMCGLTIGPYAVIGAGCAVIKNVPAHTIAVGNPARWVGYACRCGRTLNDELKSEWWEDVRQKYTLPQLESVFGNRFNLKKYTDIKI